MDVMGSCTLKVGQSLNLSSGIFTTQTIIYAGQISDKIFSIAVQWRRGHNAAAYNIYIPVDERNFTVFNSRIKISYVSPTEIRLSLQ